MCCCMPVDASAGTPGLSGCCSAGTGCRYTAFARVLIYPCLQEARQIEQARAQLAADAARRDAQQQAAAREGRVAAQRQVSLLFNIS